MNERLWHYTCADMAPSIMRSGVLLPNTRRRLLPDPAVWATDLVVGDVPDLDLALGLRGLHHKCDRTAYRFAVLDVDAFERWTDYARREVRAGRLDRSARELLDSTPGGFPRHWFVSRQPVRVMTGVSS